MSNHKIFLIDDDEVYSYIFRTIFTQIASPNQELVEFRSSTVALQHLLASPPGSPDLPSLIFLDICMPCLQGWDLLEELNRSDKKNLREIPVVIQTTSIHPKDKRKQNEFPQVVRYQPKPIDSAIMYDLLNRMCHA